MIIDQWHFEYQEIKIPAISTAGTHYQRRAQVGMPTISSDVPNCVFYLYETVEDARRGDKAGGTGFFFTVEPGGGVPGHYYYAVTNWHNIFSGRGAPVIRVNTKDGNSDIFELDHLDWIFKPSWHDLAIADVTLDLNKHNVSFVGADFMATREELSEFGIGLGADIFMVGRFMDHDGDTLNIPAVRFGNIAVMPQPIKQTTGAEGLPSYILDLHSRTGYSGSPVFVFHHQTKISGKGTLSIAQGQQWIRLLGVHWGQFPERWEIDSRYAPVVKRNSDAEAVRELNAEYVKGFSGMTLAIPAEAIMELLEMPKLREPREKAFEEARRAHQNSPVAESEEPPTKGDNPQHREDFNSLLDAAVEGKKQDH
ncbi:MAG: hypothetical protein ISR47_08625 [Rhodospirillales bacterium]|nr:hypothetical protein [Rhodospirillales bacterium]